MSQAICASVLPASKTPVKQKIYHHNTLHLYPAQTRKRTKKELPNSYTSDVVETVTSETETWLKFRDETETLS